MGENGKAVIMQQRLKRAAISVFWIVVGVFLLTILMVMTNQTVPVIKQCFMYIFFPATAALFVFGIALIILAVKAPLSRALKTFLIMTGSAAAAFELAFLLHNLVYGLMIHWFGDSFWDSKCGGDEAFFFVIAIIVCPLVFLIGTVGSITILVRNRHRSVD